MAASRLFAFGHGLSYTKFKYAKATLTNSKVTADGTVRVAFNLKNAGAVAGDEVPQVYFRHKHSAVAQPKLALCGFTRVNLGAGETKQVTVEIPASQFRYWDTTQKKYVVEPGDYEFLIGAASNDIRLRAAFSIVSAK